MSLGFRFRKGRPAYFENGQVLFLHLEYYQKQV